jgi:hypothetical protein
MTITRYEFISSLCMDSHPFAGHGEEDREWVLSLIEASAIING